MSNALLICWHCLNKHFAVSSFPFLYFTSLMVGFPAKERRRKEKKKIFRKARHAVQVLPILWAIQAFVFPWERGKWAVKKFRTGHFKTHHCGILIIVSRRHLRNSRRGRALCPPPFYLKQVITFPLRKVS